MSYACLPAGIGRSKSLMSYYSKAKFHNIRGSAIHKKPPVYSLNRGQLVLRIKIKSSSLKFKIAQFEF
jgi:hypothetical protein